MNPQDLLDYTLGQLDDEALAQVEARLAADPDAAERAERLGRNLRRLLDDGLDPQPPPGLAHRTILKVGALAEREARPTIEFAPPPHMPLRWRDYAAVAAILVLGLGMTLPALQSSRMSYQSAGCLNNLMRIGQGMLRYDTMHQMMPAVGPEDGPTPVNGLQFARMRDLGLLDPDALDCPGNGVDRMVHQVPPVRSLVERPGASAASYLIHYDYAAPMGYFEDLPGQGRRWHAPECPDSPSSLVPLSADQPPRTSEGWAMDGNSPNHAACGQNVVFSDMHAGHFPGRRLGPDADMFLNRYRHTRPGLDPNDHVLGAGNVIVLPEP